VGTVEVSNEHMEYDELNRMTSHEGPNGTESFTYRGAEWHRYSANGKTFLYDGDNVLADIAGGVTDALYVTPFLDQNLSLTNSGSTYYYSQDGLGSVRTLTDSAGALVNSYDYLAFGGAYSPTTTVSLPQRYTYTGREKNPTSDLMYYRYRQYDPRVGRFGARDPVEYRDGPGLYIYAHNETTTERDTHGLWGELPPYNPPNEGKPCDLWEAEISAFVRIDTYVHTSYQRFKARPDLFSSKWDLGYFNMEIEYIISYEKDFEIRWWTCQRPDGSGGHLAECDDKFACTLDGVMGQMGGQYMSTGPHLTLVALRYLSCELVSDTERCWKKREARKTATFSWRKGKWNVAPGGVTVRE